MISPKIFYEVLKANKVSFFTGVPDSLLKEFCAYIETISKDSSHIIAANEDSAIAVATGHHLASGDISLVYLQNSGLGNTMSLMPFFFILTVGKSNLPLISGLSSMLFGKRR